MATPRITLDQWQALVAVVDAAGYAHAAKALHKSQSAVTYLVQQLESALGVKAFRIEGRRAVLTSTGEQLYRRARYLLAEAQAIEQAAQRLSAGWEAEIRIAVEIIFPGWLLLQCLDRFGQESPHTRIEVIEQVIGDQTDALSRGAADLAIFASIPPGFLGDPLMRERFVLAARPEHPLHQLGRPATLRDLRDHRHLVVRESSPQRATPPSVEVSQRWTVSHLSTSIEAVKAGYGFAWLPAERIRSELKEGTLKAVPLATGGERFAELYLIIADPAQAGPGTRRLAEILRETVTEECSKYTAGS